MSDWQPGPDDVLVISAGRPTDEELAALVTVLSALATAGENAGRTAAQRVWASPAARLQTAYGPACGGWRTSGLPH
ncbi:acyl-CoA carboxylase subunit epsilon [Lapillicoccus sp.]|uniref:acyl-CoA carboxylase subunit epsilon n=1 Tax=Lapillicoccus sp. TaxID=1909287 RepID=UPI00326358FB